MFADMLQAMGLYSGSVYATGIMKARDVKRMAADFRAQESIRPMTQRILKENNCLGPHKIARREHIERVFGAGRRRGTRKCQGSQRHQSKADRCYEQPTMNAALLT
jgi:hypothetical protein